MLVGGGTDQLDIDVHGIGDLLYAALKDVGRAQLFADVAQIIRRALIFLRRRARDYFEGSNLRQARQNFVLNTLGKISIRFVVAQIIERQNGNALARDINRRI